LISAIAHLSYVQIDTISVVERAHHHTLWNRLADYSASTLDQALEQRSVFEYWAHAAAYLPMSDYRFTLPRKRAIASGERHWYDKDPKQAKHVLEVIRSEGPMRASDFKQIRSIKRAGWGDQKPAKRALEQLFMEGELMVSHRHGFQKVFDLTERVLPGGIDSSVPTEQEYCDHLIQRYLSAHGLGNAAEIAYLRKGLKPSIARRCQSLCEDKQLRLVNAAGKAYFAHPVALERLSERLKRSTIKILSPFDNLVIQRARLRDFFNFDYQLECYVPKAKRQYGYFVLPILAGDEFIGRMDAKIDRKTKVLTVRNLSLATKEFDQVQSEFSLAMRAFLDFNRGTGYQFEKGSLNGEPLSLSQMENLVDS